MCVRVPRMFVYGMFGWIYPFDGMHAAILSSHVALCFMQAMLGHTCSLIFSTEC